MGGVFVIIATPIIAAGAKIVIYLGYHGLLSVLLFGAVFAIIAGLPIVGPVRLDSLLQSPDVITAGLVGVIYAGAAWTLLRIVKPQLFQSAQL